MQEQRVSFETAKLAKEKGFKEKCDSAYVFRNEYHELSTYKGTLIHDNILLCDIKAPTQSLLQKWLREKYNIHINITKVYECSTSPAKFCGWNIYIAGKDFETVYDINSELISKYFNSYEEALEFGLQEALKLI